MLLDVLPAYLWFRDSCPCCVDGASGFVGKQSEGHSCSPTCRRKTSSLWDRFLSFGNGNENTRRRFNETAVLINSLATSCCVNNESYSWEGCSEVVLALRWGWGKRSPCMMCSELTISKEKVRRPSHSEIDIIPSSCTSCCADRNVTFVGGSLMYLMWPKRPKTMIRRRFNSEME